MARATGNAGARRALRKQQQHPSTGIFHRGHCVGRRHLVGDPDAVPGRRVLRADGGVSRAPRHCEPTGRANARPMTGSTEAIHSAASGGMDCFVALLLAMTEN